VANPDAQLPFEYIKVGQQQQVSQDVSQNLTSVIKITLVKERFNCN